MSLNSGLQTSFSTSEESESYIIALPSVTCVVVHAAAVPCEAALCIAFVSSSLSVRLSSYNSSMESGRISDLVDYLMHV